MHKHWITCSILGAAMSVGYPSLKGQTYAGALILDRNSPTQIMTGYAVWWNEGDWSDPHRYNVNYNADMRAKESAEISKGNQIDTMEKTHIGNYGQKVVAWPTLPWGTKGYNSYDPTLIRHHIGQFKDLGIDIVAFDLTNGVSNVLFNAGSNGGPNAANAHIKAVNQLYPIYATEPNCNIRLVPVIGAQEEDQYQKDEAGNYVLVNGQRILIAKGDFTKWFAAGTKTGPQLAAEYVLNLMQQYPKTVVLYENKPLLMLFCGVQSRPDSDILNTIDLTTREKFTIRIVRGYADDQPQTWWGATTFAGVAEIYKPYTRLKSNVWSWCDRPYNNEQDRFSTYTLLPKPTSDADRIEFVSMNGKSATKSLITAILPNGAVQQSWGSPMMTYRGGALYHQMLTLAKKGNPLFIFNSHYNFFNAHDAGFTKALSRDIEPNNLWGTDTYAMLKRAIKVYRDSRANLHVPRFTEIATRGLTGPGANDQLITGLTITPGADNAGQRILVKAIGPTLTGLGVAGAGTNPRLNMYDSNGVLVASNEDWAACTDLPSGQRSLDATRQYKNSAAWLLANNYGQRLNSLEAAITADVQPGTYTFVNYDVTSNLAVSHLRINTLDEIGPSPITALSARSRVEIGGRILISVIKADGPMRVLIQGRGPSLNGMVSPFLKDPQIAVYTPGASTPFFSQTDVGLTPALKAQCQAYQPGWTLDDKDCAAIVDLPSAGEYHVHVGSQSASAADWGIAWMEVRRL